MSCPRRPHLTRRRKRGLSHPVPSPVHSSTRRIIFLLEWRFNIESRTSPVWTTWRRRDMGFSLQFRSSGWTILGRMLKDCEPARSVRCSIGHGDPSGGLVHYTGLEVLSFPLLIVSQVGWARLNRFDIMYTRGGYYEVVIRLGNGNKGSRRARRRGFNDDYPTSCPCCIPGWLLSR
jgi:hypothetical protein